MTGAFEARKKDGTVYYRASLTYRRKHISLGSYGTEKEAAKAYTEGQSILHENNVTIENFLSVTKALDPEKAVLLLNLRDNHTYFKTPIYLRQGYFSYFVDGTRELKFSNDDLFYYSEHRILLHNGHYYVNDYGMQYGILERFGIRPWSVAGRDYLFANGDENDFRYENIIVVNHYHGVFRQDTNGVIRYETRIHLNGDFVIGRFRTEAKAAVAYNKAADLAVAAGIAKSFPQNYVSEYTAPEYADVYRSLTMPERFLAYLSPVKAKK